MAQKNTDINWKKLYLESEDRIIEMTKKMNEANEKYELAKAKWGDTMRLMEELEESLNMDA